MIVIYMYGNEAESSSKQATLSVDKMQRYVRAKRRSEIRPLFELSNNEQTKENRDPLRDFPEEAVLLIETLTEEKRKLEEENTALNAKVESITAELAAVKEELAEVKEDAIKYEEKIEHLKVNAPITTAFIEDSDVRTKFYTNLPTYMIFTILFDLLSPLMKKSIKLSLKDELLLCLMKLRLNLTNEDLAYRFGVAKSAVSRIFHKWLDVMYVKMKSCIRWLDKETVRQTLPNVFIKHFQNVRCTIDCSEIFIERPTSFKARAQTYSNYKKHNTVKFLIGITPAGVISYLSPCWGGRVSDKELTRESGFLNLIDPGDEILANQGFLIGDELAIRGARLTIPAFTRGKSQLSREEVERSRQMAMVRIHVERVIGVMKNRYTILQS